MELMKMEVEVRLHQNWASTLCGVESLAGVDHEAKETLHELVKYGGGVACWVGNDDVGGDLEDLGVRVPEAGQTRKGPMGTIEQYTLEVGQCLTSQSGGRSR